VTGRILAIGLGLIVLLGGAYAWWTLRNDRQIHDDRTEALRSELAMMRGAIRKFRDENGRYPHSLDELTPKYLRRIPVDPFTRAADWKLDTEETVVPSNDFGATTPEKPQTFVIDVHSNAGPPYSDY
jgi:hypothetical protein